MAIEPHFHLMPSATSDEIDAGVLDTVAATPANLAHKWADLAYATRITSKTTASSATISTAKFVQTDAYDDAVHPTKGAALYRQSDVSEVAGVDPRFWFVTANGRYFLIDTINQKITLTMAGGVGNLTYEMQSGLNNGGGNGNGVLSTEGYIRTGGTNDQAAMLALDAFATDNGIPAYIDADHFTSPQTKLTAAWYGIDGPYQFNHTLWAEYFTPYDGTQATITEEIQVGYWFENPGPHSGFYDLKIIGQWNTPGASKPSVCVPDMPLLGPGGGLGHKGAIILIGEQYYLTEPEAPITNCNLRIMIMRAGRKTSTGHYSQSNGMIFASGYVEHCDFEIGLFGKTNTRNDWVILMLYGLQYDPTLNGFLPYNDLIPNKTQSTLVQTFHPCYCTLRFLTDIDNTTTFALIGKPWELNSCGPTHIYSYYAKGCAAGAGTISCGDYTDVYTCPRQKGLPNRGIEVDFIKADACYQNGVLGPFNNGGFNMIGGGTSSGRTAIYDDTASNVCTPDPSTLTPNLPQIQWVGGNLGITKFTTQIFDVNCAGFDLEVLNSANNPLDADAVVGILIGHGRGHINLGALTFRGDCQRGLEIEHFNGDISYTSYNGIGTLSYEFSKGGSFPNTNNDKGSASEIQFTSGGTHVAAIGETITGLTSGATGIVRKVVVTAGSFAAGNAAGYLYVDIASGTWTAENATLTGGGNDMTVAAVSVGIYKPGYGTAANPTENACAQLVGTTFTAGVLASNVAIGATKIPLVDYLPTQVFTGDRVRVGTIWTTAVECTPSVRTADVATTVGTVNVDFGGVKYLTVDPLTTAVLSGATITVDQRGYVKEFSGAYANSQYGLIVNNCDVKHCDIRGVRRTGQHAAWVHNGSHVEFVGGLPPTVGLSGLTDSTVRVEDDETLAVFHGCDIPHNPSVSVAVQLPTSQGRAVFDGCHVESPTTLHPTTEGNISWDKIRVVNCYDYAGNPLRNGPYPVTPTVRTGGSATGIPISVNASRITEDGSSGVDLTIEVTLGTVSAPTAGTLDIINSTSDTADWPAPNAAQTGIVDVIANGLLLPASVYCEIGTNKTITLYSQGATGRTALTNANIATGMQFRARLRYTRAAS